MNSIHSKNPSLPLLLQWPLKLIPGKIQFAAIQRTLNTLFREPLAQGELEFLESKTINIHVDDARLKFCVSLRGDRLNVSREHPRPDLTIHGEVYSFLVLATRKEDADTLFFRRQLKSEGDTELGLFVKNFLDGLEPEQLPAHRVLEPLMQKALRFADKTPAVIDRLPASLRKLV